MRVLKCSFGAIGALSAVTLLLALAIMLPAFSGKFFEHEFGKNDTYNRIAVEKPELMCVARHMIDYLRGKQADLSISAVVDGSERQFFDETDVAHMKDVKVLFTVCRMAACVSAAMIILAVILLRKDLMFLLKCIRNTAITAVCMLAVVVCAAVINFEAAFVIFHKIFFRNDLWLLDVDKSLLINILPEQFFSDIAVLIGALFASSCGLVIVVAIAVKFATKVKAVDQKHDGSYCNSERN